MTTRATITASTLRDIGHAEEFVVVGLRGGDAQYAVDAVSTSTAGSRRTEKSGPRSSAATRSSGSVC